VLALWGQTILLENGCRLAVYRISMSELLALNQYKSEMEEAQHRLDHLTRGSTAPKGAGDASDVAIRERTFKLARFLPGTESAEFFILLASAGKSKNLQGRGWELYQGIGQKQFQGKQLKNVDFNVPAPSDVPTCLVRRGILGYYEYTRCSLVPLETVWVGSVN
jgi:hypothetical protein